MGNSDRFFSVRRLHHDARTLLDFLITLTHTLDRLREINHKYRIPELDQLIDILTTEAIAIMNLTSQLGRKIQKVQESYDQVWTRVSQILHALDHEDVDTSGLRHALSHVLPVFRRRGTEDLGARAGLETGPDSG